MIEDKVQAEPNQRMAEGWDDSFDIDLEGHNEFIQYST
jgi:hypothetical protein